MMSLIRLISIFQRPKLLIVIFQSAHFYFALFQLKVRKEERKRIIGKWNEQKLVPESSNVPKKSQEKSKFAGVMRKNVSMRNI